MAVLCPGGLRLKAERHHGIEASPAIRFGEPGLPVPGGGTQAVAPRHTASGRWCSTTFMNPAIEIGFDI